jgi:hypothetical protein
MHCRDLRKYCKIYLTLFAAIFVPIRLPAVGAAQDCASSPYAAMVDGKFHTYQAVATERIIIKGTECIMIKQTCLGFLLFCYGLLPAQPQPGDLFREYIWWNEQGDAGGSYRVGGKRGEVYPNRGSKFNYINTPVVLQAALDLEHAVKAEVVLEKVLCHDGTRGLAVSINDHDFIPVPESSAIPEPQWEYQHHTYPIVPVPLQNFKPGPGNSFRLKVDSTHAWNWPQPLIYGVHFRIYYDKAKPHPAGRIVSLENGDVIGLQAELKVEASSTDERIKQVDYIGHYEDVNFEGDGHYTQWHYHYYHGDLIHHIGTAKNWPYHLTWDTSWLPDQSNTLQIAARIVDDTNLIYFTPAVTGLKLKRKGWKVELCKPYEVPKSWVTRKKEFAEKIDIKGDVKKAVAAQLVFNSWSPGYMNGIYINDIKVFDKQGPKYKYYEHRIALNDVKVLKSGVNVIKTGKTPLHDGHMVHGMEVNWPGIMVLIRYK